MARTSLTFTCETDLVYDCLADLSRIHEALTHRHGDRFRALERRIEAISVLGAEAFGWPEVEPGRMVMTPPKAWTDLVADARRLGVI